MSSEDPVEHGVTEKERAPLRVPTNTMIAATTTTMRKAATTHTSFFSPQKRKRDTSPLEIPETPWRLQQSIPHDDDDNDDNEKVKVELTAEDEVVASGQVSPRSNKLASQLSDLNLSGKLAGSCLLPRNLEITMTLEEEPPAAKKVKRRGRPPNIKKKAAITTGGNGGGSDEDLAAVPRQKGKDALSFSGENANGNGKEVVNGDTRQRLRSPPLPQMDSDTSVNYSMAAVTDESDGDVDSDDPDQLGIGYKPTLMQRHARDRKRMQQVIYVPCRYPINYSFFLLRIWYRLRNIRPVSRGKHARNAARCGVVDAASRPAMLPLWLGGRIALRRERGGRWCILICNRWCWSRWWWTRCQRVR